MVISVYRFRSWVSAELGHRTAERGDVPRADVNLPSGNRAPDRAAGRVDEEENARRYRVPE